MSSTAPPASRKYVPASERYAYGGALRRFASIPPRGHRVKLAADHPAIVDGRSLFPSRVEDQADRPRLLIDGHNSRKIGRRVMKGHWRGFPIFTLTLEERATCPSSCLEWATCYGNSMNWARRIKHGRAFEERLWEELAEKQRVHPDGFVVRLHILGDFYSVDYAELWAEAMETYPALRVFGYTARAPDSGRPRTTSLTLNQPQEPPQTRTWCAQCERQVYTNEASACQSRWCKAKEAA